MESLIIIDVPNLAHRNYFAMSKSEMSMPVIYGILRDLQILRRHLGSSRFAFCFDSIESLRKEVYPGYKSQRRLNPNKELILDEMEQLRVEILPMLGYQNIYQMKGAEADDLIGMLCKRKKETDSDHWLVSCDQDLYQLLKNYEVAIWNPQTKCRFTEEEMLGRFNLRPDQWVTYKAIVGCNSDNIRGIDRVGPVIATAFLNRHDPNARPMYQTATKAIKEGWESVVEPNKLLIQLPYHLLKDSIDSLVEDQIQEGAWNDVMGKFGLPSLIGKQP